MIIYRPTKEYVDRYIGLTEIKESIHIPTNSKDEWNKSHTRFILRVLLPQIHPPLGVWRITAEAYLTKIKLEQNGEFLSFEQVMSDGSSVVPDLSYAWGNIKDPWGVAHDWVYMLHKLNLNDVYDNKWKLLEAHDMYRKGWYASKMHIIGSVWWIGLILGGWVVWNKQIKNHLEDINGILWYPD